MEEKKDLFPVAEMEQEAEGIWERKVVVYLLLVAVVKGREVGGIHAVIVLVVMAQGAAEVTVMEEVVKAQAVAVVTVMEEVGKAQEVGLEMEGLGVEMGEEVVVEMEGLAMGDMGQEVVVEMEALVV